MKRAVKMGGAEGNQKCVHVQEIHQVLLDQGNQVDRQDL